MNVLAATKKRHDANAEQARRAFANHVVEPILTSGLHRHWRCAEPGTGIYHFHVVTFPGRLIVTGDVGFLAVERTTDMIAWARSAVGSIEYFAEKVPSSIQVREYSPEVAEAWFREELLDEDLSDQTREAIADFIATIDFQDRHRFYGELYASEELSGHVAACDYPTFEDYTPNFLWCRQAVIWLLEHLD